MYCTHSTSKIRQQTNHDSQDRSSFESIGKSIGTSRETARSLYTRALKKLKQHPELKELTPHKPYGSL
ncbi:MAG: sigma factor-like helix-turn-helix DNA-binding protein [Coraliomargaritaceae bacterium]